MSGINSRGQRNRTVTVLRETVFEILVSQQTRLGKLKGPT